MVNVCDNGCYLMMKVILVKEVMSCDVSPVAMFLVKKGEGLCTQGGENPEWKSINSRRWPADRGILLLPVD